MNGPSSPNNTLRRFGISGADLGIIWDNGDPYNDQVLIAFGDTFGNCRVRGQQWRRNTMFRSQDRTLSHGINVPYGIFFDKYSGSPVDLTPEMSCARVVVYKSTHAERACNSVVLLN